VVVPGLLDGLSNVNRLVERHLRPRHVHPVPVATGHP